MVWLTQAEQANNSSTAGVLTLLEGKVLAPCQSWICQQLPQDLACWSLKQSDVLLTITIPFEINDLKVTFLYRAHEPLVPIVIHLVRIKVRVVQHLLYEILDKSGIKLLLLGEILHNSLACSEKTWHFPVHLGQKVKLLTHNMLYNILYNI